MIIPYGAYEHLCAFGCFARTKPVNSIHVNLTMHLLSLKTICSSCRLACVTLWSTEWAKTMIPPEVGTWIYWANKKWKREGERERREQWVVGGSGIAQHFHLQKQGHKCMHQLRQSENILFLIWSDTLLLPFTFCSFSSLTDAPHRPFVHNQNCKHTFWRHGRIIKQI